MKTLTITLLIFILASISNAYGSHCGTNHGADNVRVADKDHKDHEDHEDHEDHDKEKSDSDDEAHEGHDN